MVLYRKYRPKLFSEVVGQEHIVQTLTNAILRNILSHGYLFSGPHGTGKTTLARLFAKALNCQNRKANQFEPCCQCSSCLEIAQGRALDLVEIDAATATGIENIRELKEGIRFVPAKSKYKVFIVDECHQLSNPAAHALLKTLEEPPEHALFILATTEAQKMIPTIASRCQQFFFRKLTIDEIKKRLANILAKEGIGFEEEALDLIAIEASGAQRDAETILDEAMSFSAGNKIEASTIRLFLAVADKQAVFQMIDYLANNQAKEGIELINQIMLQATDLKDFVGSLLGYLRMLLILKINEATQMPLFLALSENEKQKARQLSQTFSEAKLKKALDLLMEAQNKMKYAAIPQLPLELAVLDIVLTNP